MKNMTLAANTLFVIQQIPKVFDPSIIFQVLDMGFLFCSLKYDSLLLSGRTPILLGKKYLIIFMGFEREGNRRTARIGHEIHLIDSLLNKGKIIVVEDSSGRKAQYPVDSSFLENGHYDHRYEVTTPENLELDFFVYSDGEFIDKRTGQALEV